LSLPYRANRTRSWILRTEANLRPLRWFLVPRRVLSSLALAILFFGLSLLAATEAQAAPRVAVAPLVAVDTATDDQLLALDELARAIQLRLEEEALVEVLVFEDVAQQVAELGKPSLSEDDYRALGTKLEAHYVLVGRLTQLGGEFSLDISLISTDPLLGTPSNLIYTAANRDELMAQVDEIAADVADGVLRAGEVLVTEVRFTEGVELPDDISGKLRTRQGDLLDPSKVYADVETLRSLEEVATAGAELERLPEGVIVIFEVVSHEVVQEAKQDISSKNRIVEIRIEGNRRIEANAIRARMVTKLAQPFQTDRLARDVRSIYRLGFFADVKVFRELGEDGWIITIEVEENPVVREVAITGNDGVKSEEIKDALTLTTGSVLDYSLLHENTARIEALYRANGYYLASVRYDIEEISEGSVSVNFGVEEGKKLRLKKIVFEGNEHYSDRKLRKGLKTKPWRFWSYLTSWYTHSGTYAEPLFAQDLRTISERYSDDGYLRSEVGEPDVNIGEKGIELVVKIEEGDRYSVGVIDVAGDATVDIQALHEKLQLEQGEIFNRSALTEDVEGLTTHYTDRGFYFANVLPLTDLRQDELVVDVVYEVEKGPLYFIREINFSGNSKTVDPVLRREMHVVEGELYSARALEISRRRIRGLGFFEEVEFEPLPTDEPGELDLNVKIVERATGSFSLGAGFSSQDGMIFTGSLSQSNLFGRGYGLRLSADIGGDSSRFYLSFTDPRFRGSAFSLTSTAFMSEVQYEDFDQSQKGVSFIFGHPLNEDRSARAFAGYSVSRLEIDQDRSGVWAAASILRERVDGDKVTSQGSLSVTSNTLDDFVAPTSGLRYSGSMEFAGLGGFTKYARVEGSLRYFIPGPEWMPKRSTFMLGGSIGYAEPFNEISDWDTPGFMSVGEENAYIAGVNAGALNGDELKLLEDIDTDLKLPLSERYFLGGLGTFQLRGYKGRSVGPRRAILQTTGGNLLTPVGRDINGKCIDPDTGEVTENDSLCNSLSDRNDDDFANLNLTDVIGGNKFISLTTEYRFSISEQMGLIGVLFMDGGNAFAEDDDMFDPSEWRYGTGAGIQWFSPFGPLQAFYGIPLNENDVEDASVFEFSMGGQNF
jgi:outer membrane protein insertion porin family